MQASAVDAPETSENLPGVHSEQRLEPATLEYDPCSHGTHSKFSSNFPAGHRLQLLAPSPEVRPAGHGWQSADASQVMEPLAFENEPAWQQVVQVDVSAAYESSQPEHANMDALVSEY